MISIQIAVAKATVGSKWWDDQDKEQKAEYIKKHPNSKYAKQAREATNGSKGAKSSKTKLHHKVKAKWGKLSDEHKKMFEREEQKPGSKARRSFGKFMKDKAKGIGKTVRHEVKEWKDAAQGVKKLATGKKMSKHEKHALKSVAIHTALVVGPMAITGGLSMGLASAAKGMALGMLEHTALIRGAQVAIFASAEASAIAIAKGNDVANMNEENVIDLLVSQMGESMATMKTKDEDWLNAVT